MIRIVLNRLRKKGRIASKDYEIGVNFSWWSKEEDKVKLVKLLESSSDSAAAG